MLMIDKCSNKSYFFHSRTLPFFFPCKDIIIGEAMSKYVK